MNRMPYTDPETLDHRTREVLDELPDYNLFKMLSRCEGVFTSFIAFNRSILNEAKLDPVLREVAIIRVGHVSGCEYEAHHHKRIGRTLGMDMADMEGLTETVLPSNLPHDWTLVAQTVDELSDNAYLTEELKAQLSDRFDEREVLDLIFAIGNYMMVARLINLSGVPIEPDGTNDPLEVRKN